MLKMCDAYIAPRTQESSDFPGVMAMIKMKALCLSSGGGCAAYRASSFLLSQQAGVCSIRNSIYGLEVNVVLAFGKFRIAALSVFSVECARVLNVVGIPFGLLFGYVGASANAAAAFLLPVFLGMRDSILSRPKLSAFLALVASAKGSGRIMIKFFQRLDRLAGGALAGFHAPFVTGTHAGVN